MSSSISDSFSRRHDARTRSLINLLEDGLVLDRLSGDVTVPSMGTKVGIDWKRRVSMMIKGSAAGCLKIV